MDNETLEVQPLTERLKSVLKDELNQTDTFQLGHIIKRVKAPEILLNDSARRKRRPKTSSLLKNYTNSHTNPENPYETLSNRSTIKRSAKIIVEVGVFFDEAAYRIFGPYFNSETGKITDMLLAYMNGVQALYHQSSLSIPIDITIVHIEIMMKQPKSLPHHNGERDKLLDSFCDYQKRINPPEDDDPTHWDMGLYISGLDFYGYDNGVNSPATMGLATVKGVCTDKYACIITEFGSTNAFGRPYPSAGFTSIYIMAHEIGHNLGMSHDSTGNYCSKEGYIMSPSRGTQGETTWSPCSAQIAQSLENWADCLKDRPILISSEYDAWKYEGYPGQKWSSKKQCEILLTDEDATAHPTEGLHTICQNLQCRTPHRSGYYFSGPALEGTDCGKDNWCEGGYCVGKREISKPITIIKGGWGPWKYEKCSTGCITKSKGYQSRRRVCDNPKPINTQEGCDGASFEVLLCNDNTICRTNRRSAISYATTKCREFSYFISELDPRGAGLQAPHETTRLWMACTIFCRRKSTGTYYTPRLELNDLGISPYFPDGTLCYSQKSTNYYCLQHHCVPEGFQFHKNALWLLSEDVPLSGNANPDPLKSINKKLLDYLSLDADGKPILTHINVKDIEDPYSSEFWTDDNDYRELPKS